MCLARRVGHVVLAGGIPPTRGDPAHLRGGGARVVCFAPALAIARKLVRTGADAIVIEGSEAGGHIGPVSTAVLAQEVLPHLTEVPVFVAGGIGRGEAMVSYLEMGAAGVQLGTRFVCAHESIAHPRFKRAFIRADGARRGAFGAARRALSGDPGARAGERGDRAVSRRCSARSSTGSTAASCRRRTRSSRSSISGPARCAAR